MSPSVVIRRYPDAVTVLVDGRIVVSGSNDDMPGEQPLLSQSGDSLS